MRECIANIDMEQFMECNNTECIPINGKYELILCANISVPKSPIALDSASVAFVNPETSAKKPTPSNVTWNGTLNFAEGLRAKMCFSTSGAKEESAWNLLSRRALCVRLIEA